VLFTGEYLHTIDPKQRLAIPAQVRAKIVPELHGEGFYIAPGANDALWLWPQKTFERMASALEQSLTPGEEIMDFEELLFPLSRYLEMDKAGRVRIPEHMLAEFGLGQTVMILGMKDHLELRDPQQWKGRRPQDPARRREIINRARSAMGKSNNQTGGGG
jgi:MraZ protein